MHAASDAFDGWEDEPTRPRVRFPGARVLVAEDDDALRAMMAERLRRDGWDVVEASSGTEAMDLMLALGDSTSAKRLSLVIMDVRMPGMSGVELAYVIRSRHWTTPIVLVTAYPEPALLDEVQQLEALLLAKPFALTRLGETAMAALAPRRRASRRSWPA